MDCFPLHVDSGLDLSGELSGKIHKHRTVQFSSVQSLNRVQLFATLWTVACQASLSLGLSRQEYWNGLPFPPPGHLPDSTFYQTALLLFIDYHLRQ